jgi:flagellar motor switch/type III secretory pathway protein FliN
VSDLRIRSEAVPDEVWPEQFLPRQARLPDAFDDDDDDGDFGPFLVAAGRALTQLFGVPVEVLPGRAPADAGDAAALPVAAVLAGLLATLRLGGDPARGGAAGGVSGVAMARYARAIAEALAGVAARVWPGDCRATGFDLDIACGAIAGHAHVAAPPRVPKASPAALAGVRLLDLPMRVRVEIASDMTLVASLLPLQAGTVLPISPVPDMPLIIGDHRIGRATVAPQPDGRQLATIVAMGVELLEGRP